MRLQTAGHLWCVMIPIDRLSAMLEHGLCQADALKGLRHIWIEKSTQLKSCKTQLRV